MAIRNERDGSIRPTMARFFAAWALASLGVLMGCDQQAALDRLAPEAEVKFARRVVDLFAARNFSAIEAETVPELRQPDPRPKFEEMARMLPSALPTSVKTLGAHTVTSASGETCRLTFEYAYPQDKWILVSTVLDRRDGKLLIAGIHFQPLAQSLETLNRFAFQSKATLHYVVLALAVLVPLLVVYALIACARSKRLNRKWLWLIFIAVGVMQFSLNWTTGTWELKPLSVLLLGAGFWQAGPSAPVMLTVALPLGAIVFLVKQRVRRRSEAAA